METEQNTWGKQVIEKALEYANYEWSATEANMLHGLDAEGRFVDTPDVTWQGEVLDCVVTFSHSGTLLYQFTIYHS